MIFLFNKFCDLRREEECEAIETSSVTMLMFKEMSEKKSRCAG